MTKKYRYFMTLSVLSCSILSACSPVAEPRQEDLNTTKNDTEKLQETTENDALVPEDSITAPTEASSFSYARGSEISDQTFHVSLAPLGEVVFSSFNPDTDFDLLADVVFTIEKNGECIQELQGMYEKNLRTNEIFKQVDAVSFLDYNKDGYDDIIIICSYSSAASPQEDADISQIRYYSGNENGIFSLEKQMSLDASSALAEHTIQAAKSFTGINADIPAEPWRQAFIDYLNHDSQRGAQEGYTLIYLDDDEIPELVEIGNSEAVGCRIVNYSDGNVFVTQLDRLNFSYIEYGNLLCNSDGLMDRYYDIVYSIKDGRLTRVAAGYYGAEDNANLEFDAAGNPIYQYEWNGQKVNEEDYTKKLNRVFDTSQAKPGYHWNEYDSAEEMADFLK